MNESKALTSLSEDEARFQRMVHDFAAEKVRPRVETMDHEAKLNPMLVKEVFDLGIMGIEIPEEFGGAGASFFMSILAIEELSKVDASVGVFVDVQNTLVNNALLRWANKEQKARYLPKLATDTVGAYALSEPTSGSDAFALATRATLDGDDYVLSGRKLFITNGSEAGLFVLHATVDPTKGYKGITTFLVERDTPGFAIGKKEDKLGIRASSTCELVFEDCRVPRANLLGEIGKGYKVAIETLNEGRIGIGAQMVGVATGAWLAAVAYASERKQFGRVISHFQAVQHDLARMAIDIESARLMVYNAARLREAGQPFVKEGAMAKYYASQVAERVTSLALEVFGGYGFTKDFPAEKFYRDSKIGKIYEGTSNVQLNTIAKEILK
jgi:butyryl-CoA dehydrogenase/short/branched chain acyl-CoA dehydrogenase